ncbi:hypothetical protein [Geomonas sp.]|uniref:hypothetical protein n=1 Tax=Geomonas sp. TaxID=2651584 RepID=UPI002B471661|nr:hypothetical protein [Geomonas sp.]HJV33485.1 hypothetical protein [Geomonas sp.]
MKKNLLVMSFLVVLAVASSMAVWASQQGAAEPACDKCAKSQQQKPCCAKEGKAAQGAADSAKVKGAECDKCPKKQADCPMHASGAQCEKCAKLGAKGPCPDCAKAAKSGHGCDKCPKVAETKPCPHEGCDKCPKKP